MHYFLKSVNNRSPKVILQVAYMDQSFVESQRSNHIACDHIRRYRRLRPLSVYAYNSERYGNVRY